MMLHIKKLLRLIFLLPRPKSKTLNRGGKEKCFMKFLMLTKDQCGGKRERKSKIHPTIKIDVSNIQSANNSFHPDDNDSHWMNTHHKKAMASENLQSVTFNVNKEASNTLKLGKQLNLSFSYTNEEAISYLINQINKYLELTWIFTWFSSAILGLFPYCNLAMGSSFMLGFV